MAPLSTAAGVVLTAFASSSSVLAFSPAAQTHRHISCTSTTSMPWRSPSHTTIMTPLQMSDEEASTDETTATDENPAEEEEAPPLDPEVVALKESVTNLESDLKAKKTQLANIKEMADKYSSTGYARQVALVENNKRMRGANMADNKSSARASVLQSFLPVLEDLDVVGARYEGNAFAKSLEGGIRSELENALGALSVSEYVVDVGQAMEMGRVVAVEEVYSEEFGKGTVVQALKSGLEISGNVVRPAEVVGSLGSESAAAEEAAAAEEGSE